MTPLVTPPPLLSPASYHPVLLVHQTIIYAGASVLATLLADPTYDATLSVPGNDDPDFEVRLPLFAREMKNKLQRDPAEDEEGDGPDEDDPDF